MDALSLRSIAVELGVSHTAPRHHFGTREGVINAVAVEGYQLLGDALLVKAVRTPSSSSERPSGRPTTPTPR